MSNLQGTSTRKQLTTSTLCFTRKDSSGNNIQTGDYHDGEQLDSANRAEN